MGKGYTKEEIENQRKERMGEERLNKQGCLMRIFEYNDAADIIVEFQDEYKGKVKTTYNNFNKLTVKNPYYPNVFSVGKVGNKYQAKINSKNTKEYNAWCHILERCFDKKYKVKKPSYKDVSCCDEWFLFENFYEWLHSQPNFDKWYNGNLWAIDKDIIIKGNKTYSPKTCCLVPPNVNSLFIKSNAVRGDYPIGVCKFDKYFKAYCSNPFTNKYECLGYYQTQDEAFYLGYKPYKEDIIRKVAQDEFDKSNITEECYQAMMKYEIEITD